VVHETGYNPARKSDEKKDMHAYLGVEIVDLGDSGVDVTSIDGLSYFYAGLDGLFFKRQLDICFLGELFSSPRISFADQIVHDDEVNVPADVGSARLSLHCFYWNRREYCKAS
jgi:hypothetical protein